MKKTPLEWLQHLYKKQNNGDHSIGEVPHKVLQILRDCKLLSYSGDITAEADELLSPKQYKPRI